MENDCIVTLVDSTHFTAIMTEGQIANLLDAAMVKKIDKIPKTVIQKSEKLQLADSLLTKLSVLEGSMYDILDEKDDLELMPEAKRMMNEERDRLAHQIISVRKQILDLII